MKRISILIAAFMLLQFSCKKEKTDLLEGDTTKVESEKETKANGVQNLTASVGTVTYYIHGIFLDNFPWLDEDDLVPQARFDTDLQLDNLDYWEMIMDVEREFNIHIPDEDLEQIMTLGDLITYVEATVPTTTGSYPPHLPYVPNPGNTPGSPGGGGGSGGGGGGGTGVGTEVYKDNYGKICGGTYEWKKIGDAYYAEFKIGFMLVNKNGNLGNIEYPRLCVSFSKTVADGNRAASNLFTEIWNESLDDLVSEVNSINQAWLDYKLRGSMSRHLQENALSRIYANLGFTNSNLFSFNFEGCNDIPKNVPVYCPTK